MIEIVDEEDDDTDLEASYQEWLKQTKRRGFKRSNPTSSSEKHGSRPQAGSKENSKTYTNASGSASRAPGSPSYPPPPATSQPPADNDSVSVKYCYNWNNLGKCTYDNCRYEHKLAPVCSYDGDCSRYKCMFTHRKQNMHFLSKKEKPQINPWQNMASPWSNPFAFQASPWQDSYMGRRNRN